MKIKSLETLQKLHEQSLNTMKQRMNLLEQQRETFTKDLQKLVTEQENEARASMQNPDLQMDYSRYADASRVRQKKLRHAIMRLSGQIAELQEHMRDEFTEMKKAEKLSELEQRRHIDKLTKRDNQAMDDLGIQFSREEQDK